MDSRLAHLIEAKTSILSRWKGQRLNKRLRKKVALLNENIKEHCRVLNQQQWAELCNSLDGQLHHSRSWKILKHLLDNTSTRSQQQDRLTKLLFTETKTHGQDHVTNTLCQKYIPSGPAKPHGPYTGSSNSALDEDFSVAEVHAALRKLNSRSAPGPDGVTNKALRNLDDPSVEQPTEYINDCWRQGFIPPSWKTAKVILIPKPGKPSSLANLRPISLTSCVGKVMEHALLTRINSHLEDTSAYPYSIIGFRAHLSAQDAMLQLKHQILDDKSRHTKAILGLDIERAFDSVAHSTILERISLLNLGERTYNYVRDFLSNRRAFLSVGDIQSEKFTLGCAGTPQGSVISPMLFNLVMLGLAQELQKLDGIEHTIYADDITIWTTTGSDGQIETALQDAIDAVENYLEGTGLRCSPDKSELLLYRPTLRGRPPLRSTHKRRYEEIQLHMRDGGTIPVVSTIRVLGMTIEANGANSTAISKILRQTANTSRLLKRVTNR